MLNGNSHYAMIKAGVPKGKWMHHVVAFTFPEECTEAQQQAFMGACAALHEKCGGRAAGIVSFNVQKNIDPRKGYAWVETAVFESAEAFTAFHAHPEHASFKALATATADSWIVIDTIIDPALTH
jgi:hypothetical protein